MIALPSKNLLKLISVPSVFSLIIDWPEHVVLANLHLRASDALPSQGFPKYAGTGFVQLRCLTCQPYPQSLLAVLFAAQLDHIENAVQFPSTANTRTHTPQHSSVKRSLVLCKKIENLFRRTFCSGAYKYLKNFHLYLEKNSKPIASFLFARSYYINKIITMCEDSDFWRWCQWEATTDLMLQIPSQSTCCWSLYLKWL